MLNLIRSILNQRKCLILKVVVVGTMLNKIETYNIGGNALLLSNLARFGSVKTYFLYFSIRNVTELSRNVLSGKKTTVLDNYNVS